MNFNELLMDDQGFPFLLEIFPTDPFFCLYHQAKLNVELHTQSLRVEVERVKRQKSRASVRQVKRDRVETNILLSQTLRENCMLREQLATIKRDSDHDIAHFSYRGYSRLHQILITIIPYISMPMAEHSD